MQGRGLVKLLRTFLIVCLICGCCRGIKYKSPRFTAEGTCEFELLTGDLGYGRVNNFFIYKQYAIFVAYDKETKTVLHVYDKNTGKPVASALHVGRGPCEVHTGVLYTSLNADNGKVTMYEQMRHAVVVCEVDSLVSGTGNAVYEEEYVFPNAIQDYYPLWEDKSLSIYVYSPRTRDKSGECRFLLQDNSDNELFRSDEYPYSENSNFRWHLYMFAKTSISPDLKHLAIGTSYGAVLETYDISDNAVKNRSTSYFIEPRIGNGEQFTNDDTILGFNDIYAADDFIYAAYDGENKGDVAPSKFFHNIAVFDWDGRPLKIFDMGMRVEHLCQDPETGLMYAVVEDADRNCHLARCDLNEK